jgi:hypothetical protein
MSKSIKLVLPCLGDVAVFNHIFKPELDKADGFFKKGRNGLDPQWAQVEAVAYDGTKPLGAWNGDTQVILPQTDFHSMKDKDKNAWNTLRIDAFLIAAKAQPGYQQHQVNTAIHNFSRAIRGHITMIEGKVEITKSVPGVIPNRTNAAKVTEELVKKQAAEIEELKKKLESMTKA